MPPSIHPDPDTPTPPDYEPTPLECAWAAGYIDARAQIGRTQPVLSVTHWDWRLLLRLSDIVGTGKVYGPYKKNAGPFYKLQIAGRPRFAKVHDRIGAYMHPVTERALRFGRQDNAGTPNTARVRPVQETVEGLRAQKETRLIEAARKRQDEPAYVDPEWAIPGFVDDGVDSD